jgi:hypothetical protein
MKIIKNNIYFVPFYFMVQDKKDTEFFLKSKKVPNDIREEISHILKE